MPNASDFTYYCSKLGIDHIEVIPDDQYGSSAILGTYEEVIKMNKINITTYNYYVNKLKQENIVFFINGKVKESNVNFKGKFIGEIIKEIEERTEEEAHGDYWGPEGVKQFLADLLSGDLNLKEDDTGTVTLPLSENTIYVSNAIMYERGSGPDQTWTETDIVDEVTLDVDNGLRTFNVAFKDEIIAQGLLGIKANSLNNSIEGMYNEDSLFGKIQAKVAQAIRETPGSDGTLKNVKLPWLYTRFGLQPNYKETVNNVNRYCANNQGQLSFGTYTQPYISDAEWNVFNYISDNPSDEKIKDYFAEVYNLEMSAMGQNYIEYQIRIKTTSQNRNAKNTFGITNSWSYSQDISSRQGRSDTRRAWNLNDYGTPVFNSVITFGGYNLNYQFLKTDDSEGSSYAYGTRVQRYATQPFVIGMVFWITDIIKNNTSGQYVRCWVVPVALNEQGEIMAPLTTGSAEQYSSDYIVNAPADFDSKGYIGLRLALPMTDDEYKYALSNNYMVVPSTCLPSNYLILDNE